jgi:hypothetical protein
MLLTTRKVAMQYMYTSALLPAGLQIYGNTGPPQSGGYQIQSGGKRCYRRLRGDTANDKLVFDCRELKTIKNRTDINLNQFLNCNYMYM